MVQYGNKEFKETMMLSLDLGVANFTRGRVDEGLLRKVAEKTLNELSKKGMYEVSIAIVGETRIRSLNRDFRKKDKVTDVLSFSFLSDDSTGIKKESVNLGEVFICLPRAKKQAVEKKISLKRELALLTAHGIIHLCGFDHERSKKEEKFTDKIQDKVLKSIFIK